jgi:hypothetical protein
MADSSRYREKAAQALRIARDNIDPELIKNLLAFAAEYNATADSIDGKAFRERPRGRLRQLSELEREAVPGVRIAHVLPDPGRCVMPQMQPYPPVCPKCRKPMGLVQAKEVEGGRKFQCVSCGEPDPMQDAKLNRWVKGELSG